MHIVNYISKITTLKTVSNYTRCKHSALDYAILFWDWVAQVMPENVANYIQFIYVIWLEKQGCKTDPVVRHMTYTPPTILSFILLHCLLAAQSW